MFRHSHRSTTSERWNKGKLIGQKQPLTQKEIWAIRMGLKAAGKPRDLALFNLAIDSKLRACDLLNLRVSDVVAGDQVQPRAIVRQRKTKRPVQFEITPRMRKTIEDWIQSKRLQGRDYLFPSRLKNSPHLSLRQYARIVES